MEEIVFVSKHSSRATETEQTTSTDKYTSRRLKLDREFINLESQQLIWLDTNESFIPPIQVLRAIIDYTKLFTNVDKCLKYIEQSKDTQTFIVCSFELIQKIIPTLPDYKCFTYVYDFRKCIDDAENILLPPDSELDDSKSWDSSFLKEKSTVYRNLTGLLETLSHDFQHQSQLEKQNAHFSIDEIQDISTNNYLSPWVTLVDFWFYLPYPNGSRERFIEELRIYYADRHSELEILKEFERDYTGNNAIQWYTRDTFLYRSLNRALRQRNIKVLFLYGFFLQDLHRQLQKENDDFRQDNSETSKLTVYHGQFISRSEIEHIREDQSFPPSSLMVNNSFFSTTVNRSLAIEFYTDQQSPPNHGTPNVLFEIEIDLHKKSCRPFANISHLSQFPGESEVLFTFGTTFSVNTNEINYNLDEKLWIIKLTLSSSFIDYKPNLMASNNRKTLKNCINLLPQTTANEMCDIPLDQLESIFHELFELYPSEICWISAIQFHTLALYHQIHLDDYDLALSNYDESIKVWESCIDDNELNSSRDIAIVSTDMGFCCHYYVKNLTLANQYYNRAIYFYHICLQQETITIAEKIKIYKELAYMSEYKTDINDDNTNYDYGFQSIKYYKLYIEHVYPIEDFEVYDILYRIGRLYVIHHEFDQAISMYEKALQVRHQLDRSIRQNVIPRDIRYIYRLLITIYRNYQPNYEFALKYENMLHEHNMKTPVYRYSRPSGENHYVMNVESHKDDVDKKHLAMHYRRLARIYQSFNEIDAAYKHLHKALDLYGEVKYLYVHAEIENVNEEIQLMYTCKLFDQNRNR